MTENLWEEPMATKQDERDAWHFDRPVEGAKEELVALQKQVFGE